MFWQTTREEVAQRALDHGAQGSMARSEAFVVGGEEVLDVLAHEPEERRVPWSSGFVDPGADLHTNSGAGGRGPARGRATRRRRTSVSVARPGARLGPLRERYLETGGFEVVHLYTVAGRDAGRL